MFGEHFAFKDAFRFVVCPVLRSVFLQKRVGKVVQYVGRFAVPFSALYRARVIVSRSVV